MKDKSYFLRADIATYKPKFVMVCYPSYQFRIVLYNK